LFELVIHIYVTYIRRKKLARPRLKLLEDTENDFQEIKMKRWREWDIIEKNGILS
jgi:hypothetical protein